MACLFGARLNPHADVTLIGHWPEQLAALRDAPLHVLELDGGESRIWLDVTSDLAAIGPVDVALILVKTPQTESAADDAARILAPDGLAVTLQNGLGNQAILARVLGMDRTTLGVTMSGAALDGPGVLRVGGEGNTFLATRPDIEPRVRDLAALFADAGLTVTVTHDIAALVWGKLVVNAAINPLTALLRVPNGALLSSSHARDLLRRAAQEVAAVAAAQDIPLPFDNAAAYAEHVAHLTARNRSSMLQDVQRGARTEIDAINGAVIRAGEALAISTPANRFLYDMIKALEESYPARNNESR